MKVKLSEVIDALDFTETIEDNFNSHYFISW